MQKIIRGAGEAWLSGGVLQSERSDFQAVGREHQARRAKAIHNRNLADSRKCSRKLPTQPLDFSLGGRVLSGLVAWMDFKEMLRFRRRLSTRPFAAITCSVSTTPLMQPMVTSSLRLPMNQGLPIIGLLFWQAVRW